MESQLPLPQSQARTIFDQAVKDGIVWPYPRSAQKRRAAIKRIQEIGEPRCEAVGEGWGEGMVCVVSPKRRLTIDHVHGDLNCWHKIRFLCDPHQHEAHRLRIENGEGWGGGRCVVCVGEKPSGSISHSQSGNVGLGSDRERREVIDGSKISESGKANDLFEPDFRSWYEAQLRKSVFQGVDWPTVERILNEGAEKSHCSSKSTERYLWKQTTPVGAVDDDRPYLAFKDSHRVTRVRPKDSTIKKWKQEDASQDEGET